jgi:hypothetical protein
MVEKFGTSEFDNSTGAYELDPTLTDEFQLAWRTMHVKSDVFCSGSIVLPDKGARQLNVGGWSLDSTQGVRLYTPDGTPGVNGTNDWEENWDELHLQVRLCPFSRPWFSHVPSDPSAATVVPFRSCNGQRIYPGCWRRTWQ